MARAVGLYASLIKAIEAPGMASIRGLATDIANYTPLKEPYLSPSNQTVLSSAFYQYAPRCTCVLISSHHACTFVPDFVAVSRSCQTQQPQYLKRMYFAFH